MKKILLILMSIQFLVYLGFGIIIPVLPEVILEQNYNEIHVGGLLTIYSLASFFTAPLWGMLSDRIGRKTLILVGLVGFSLSFWLFSLFFDSLFMLYLSRVVGGLFSGAFMQQLQVLQLTYQRKKTVISIWDSSECRLV